MIPHITVCICTYRRTEFLEDCLAGVLQQIPDGAFTYSVVVCDNDGNKSAQSVVEMARNASPIAIEYVVEAQQNIAMARNLAIQHAVGDFLAFIDDDEIPHPQWLATLYSKLIQSPELSGILGPVKPKFQKEPPSWVKKARLYDRPSYPTGTIITWRQGRTGNVLLRKSVLDNMPQPFDPRFGSGGEDQDLFRRLISNGKRFIWCEEAMVPEIVPESRWRISFLIRRALLRGKLSKRHHTFGPRDLLISLIAIPMYSIVLPFAALLGTHIFVRYLISLFDHIGRVLEALALNPVPDRYVTE